ncbi:hypothetical protein D9756_007038 [Leucocoprinus leucothites]|uniref:Uncharacterized protein n=1 Tax=Leucocoprinus leucothites TaxID=201217 RepID=A0A8H5D744_9AGAR|nr:hypothetical protein D9756_007038 [Leucoagaricus leucothites]
MRIVSALSYLAVLAFGLTTALPVENGPRPPDSRSVNDRRAVMVARVEGVEAVAAGTRVTRSEGDGVRVNLSGRGGGGGGGGGGPDWNAAGRNAEGTRVTRGDHWDW